MSGKYVLEARICWWKFFGEIFPLGNILFGSVWLGFTRKIFFRKYRFGETVIVRSVRGRQVQPRHNFPYFPWRKNHHPQQQAYSRLNFIFCVSPFVVFIARHLFTSPPFPPPVTDAQTLRLCLRKTVDSPRLELLKIRRVRYLLLYRLPLQRTFMLSRTLQRSVTGTSPSVGVSSASPNY